MSGRITLRTTLLMCSVDLPARCLCANMKQFNGKHGCIYCENPGTARPSCPSVRDWLPGYQVYNYTYTYIHTCIHEQKVENNLRANAIILAAVLYSKPV